MLKIAKQSILFFLIATLVIVPFGATALAKDKAQTKDIGAGAMISDLVFLRPLGIVAWAAGTALYVVSLPFWVTGGNQSQAAEKLVYEPGRFTFARPLGDI